MTVKLKMRTKNNDVSLLFKSSESNGVSKNLNVLEMLTIGIPVMQGVYWLIVNLIHLVAPYIM
jgi:hypothetical protein